MARNLIIIIFSSIFILNCSDKNSDQQKSKDARDSFSKIDKRPIFNWDETDLWFKIQYKKE